MTDRENVIRGLECCMLSYKDGCDECPYIGKGMCQELLGEHAIARLKAQEPRVMTLEEVAKCSMCWLEDDVMLAPALFIGMERRANGTKSDVFLVNAQDSDDCEFWYDLDDYGKTWRCWSSEPTQEQREATQWMI